MATLINTTANDVQQRGMISHNPMHLAPNGNYYQIWTDLGGEVRIEKASSPTGTWSRVYTGPASTRHDIVTSILEGTTIHFVAYEATGSFGYGFYFAFDTSTDTISVANEDIAGFEVTLYEWDACIEIGIRPSDDDVIILYTGIEDKVMGGSKMRCDYGRRESGT